MNNQNLSEKLNYILKELNMNKKQFFDACKEINEFISKPTVLNVINGKNKGYPSLETIDTIIKVCQNSNHNLLKNISYNYLLNEKLVNITDENSIINEKVYLTDKSIDIISKLKRSSNTDNVLNDIIENIDYNYWENIGYLNALNKIQKANDNLIQYHNKEFNINEFKDIKELYVIFKKNELQKQRKKLSATNYKKYLIKLFNYKEIFNEEFSIEELEYNYFEMLKSSCVDLSCVLEEFISNNENISNLEYDKDELERFSTYLRENYKYNEDYINSYIEFLSVVNHKFIISTVDFKDYLRYNFKSQHAHLKQINKYINILKKYREAKINLDLEEYNKINNFVNKLSELLVSLNKFFRLVINEYMLEYFNSM